MAKLDKIYLKVLYNDVNITADISHNLLSFNYTDNLSEADTLDIELEDADQKWQNEWYPEKGAKIKASIGIDGGKVLECGTFEIDEIELVGAPDAVNIRCIAAGFKEGQKRSKKSHVHEGKTLAEIVRTVASSAGLKVKGDVGNVRVGRMVQRQATDLRFLKNLARKYGYIFNVRDGYAIFMKSSELEDKPSVGAFKKTDLMNFSIRDKSTKTYKLASVRYHNPETGETVTHEETSDMDGNSDDVLELEYTAETEAQAREMTKEALRAANRLQQSGSISLPGSPVLCSGNVISLQGLGRLSGDYIIKSASHTIGNSEGWLVDAEIYKVNYKEKKDA